MVDAMSPCQVLISASPHCPQLMIILSLLHTHLTLHNSHDEAALHHILSLYWRLHLSDVTRQLAK